MLISFYFLCTTHCQVKSCAVQADDPCLMLNYVIKETQAARILLWVTFSNLSVNTFFMMFHACCPRVAPHPLCHNNSSEILKQPLKYCSLDIVPVPHFETILAISLKIKIDHLKIKVEINSSR